MGIEIDERVLALISRESYWKYDSYLTSCGDNHRPSIVIKDCLKYGFRKWRYLLEVDFYVDSYLRNHQGLYKETPEVIEKVEAIFNLEPFWRLKRRKDGNDGRYCTYDITPPSQRLYARYLSLEAAIKVANCLAELPREYWDDGYEYPAKLISSKQKKVNLN